jgi:hypothetical protein
MPPKVDFDIELATDADSSTADGLVLGVMPESAARQLRGAIRVTVRSIKKRQDVPGKVLAIQARAVPADGAGKC